MAVCGFRESRMQNHSGEIAGSACAYCASDKTVGHPAGWVSSFPGNWPRTGNLEKVLYMWCHVKPGV